MYVSYNSNNKLHFAGVVLRNVQCGSQSDFKIDVKF